MPPERWVLARPPRVALVKPVWSWHPGSSCCHPHLTVLPGDSDGALGAQVRALRLHKQAICLHNAGKVLNATKLFTLCGFHLNKNSNNL